MEFSGRDELILCDKAIREGVIYDFIIRHRERLKAEAEIPDLRRRNVSRWPVAVRLPKRIACMSPASRCGLFDQTTRLHRLGPTERNWLEYAAILHDIGYLINERQHHKHAYYLITHSGLGGSIRRGDPGRRQRRALPPAGAPTQKHEEFDALSPQLQRIVRILSALLRIADGLDRTHFSVVRTLDVRIGATITIIVHVTGDARVGNLVGRGGERTYLNASSVVG